MKSIKGFIVFVLALVIVSQGSIIVTEYKKHTSDVVATTTLVKKDFVVKNVFSE